MRWLCMWFFKFGWESLFIHTREMILLVMCSTMKGIEALKWSVLKCICTANLVTWWLTVLKQSDKSIFVWWFYVMVVFKETLLVMMISTSSPSWTWMVGPRYSPFTMRRGLVLHKHVTIVHSTCKHKNCRKHIWSYSRIKMTQHIYGFPVSYIKMKPFCGWQCCWWDPALSYDDPCIT